MEEEEAVSELRTSYNSFNAQDIGWMLQVPTSRLTSVFRDLFPDLKLQQGKQNFFTLSQVAMMARAVFKYPRAENLADDVGNTLALIQHLSLTAQKMTRGLKSAVELQRFMQEQDVLTDVDDTEAPAPVAADLIAAVNEASSAINETKAHIWEDVYNYLSVNFKVNPKSIAQESDREDLLPVNVIEEKGLIRECLDYVAEYMNL